MKSHNILRDFKESLLIIYGMHNKIAKDKSLKFVRQILIGKVYSLIIQNFTRITTYVLPSALKFVRQILICKVYKSNYWKKKLFI